MQFNISMIKPIWAVLPPSLMVFLTAAQQNFHIYSDCSWAEVQISTDVVGLEELDNDHVDDLLQILLDLQK